MRKSMVQERHLSSASLFIELQHMWERVAQNTIVCHMAIYNYLIQQIANLLSDF